MHTKCPIRFPKYFLEVEIFMTFISTERLNDRCLSEFGRDIRRRYYLIVWRIKKTNRISSTIIHNIIEEARETFTVCKFEVTF